MAGRGRELRRLGSCRSESAGRQAGRQGGPSPCVLGTVQEWPGLCPLHPGSSPVLMDTAASALVQGMGDAWRLVLRLHPGDFRGSLNLLTGLGAGGRAGRQARPGHIAYRELAASPTPRGHWVMQPTSSSH